MSSSSASAPGLSKFPETVCVLDIETSGRHSRMPDRADLAVVGIKFYTWDKQQKAYRPGSYEHYTPTDLLALQQRLDSLSAPIIGHNLFGFDYRVLRRHLNLERVIEKSVDTLHLLYELSGGGEEGSLYALDKLAKENFGERKLEKGSTVPKLIEQGKIAEVLAYNERDCDLTFRVWWKMVSDRKISVGEEWVEGFEDYELEEVIYDLEETDISVLTCATPRFTYAAWDEQLKRDGWIVMPPPERKRREKELQRQREEARAAASQRTSAMHEFIQQHTRDDIPRKYAHSDSDDDEPGDPALDEARALCRRAGLPEDSWSESTIARLIGGDRIFWRKQNPEEGQPDLAVWFEAVKGILALLTAEGYEPRYYAYAEPGYDVVYLEVPPPPPPTLAQQYVDRMQERYAELDALFGPAGIGFQIPRIAVGVHPAYTDALNSLRGDSDGYVVFQDGSYIFDTDELDLFELRPKVLTAEETADLDAYVRDHPD
jgi:hypothetical protein